MVLQTLLNTDSAGNLSASRTLPMDETPPNPVAPCMALSIDGSDSKFLMN